MRVIENEKVNTVETITKEEREKREQSTKMFASRAGRDSRGISSIEEVYKKIYSNSTITPDMLQNYLRNPIANTSGLQDVSQKMLLSNGILKEFINYKATILTQDHYIYASDSFRYKDKDSILKDELKVALHLEKFHVKTLIRWITERLLINGEVYIYKRELKDGILMQEIPQKFCKIVQLDEFGVFRYGIDLGKIDDKDIEFYPDEIQKAKKLKNKTNKKKFKGNYYIVGENGIAFQMNQWDSKGLPYYMHLFPALMNLSESENIDNLSNELDNYKLLHQKIDTDKDGNILVESDTAEMYHEALKQKAPDGVGAITTPYTIKPITLGDGKLKNYEHTNKIKESIYDNAGIANDLFNGNSKTNEATILSAIIDTLIPLKIQSLVETYLNYELKLKFKRGGWKVQFVSTTHYNRSKMMQEERENSAVYTSKKRYLAIQGHTPLQALNILYSENLMGLEEWMKPMQTAHTLSGKGRPTNSENPNSDSVGEQGD
ncbi:hypothetical protein [Peptostreptococcus faecalis]|uniref:hypothetical protein n=1 Tax=Peptostreptococcus faecalis TaxID=2045015 RepID=UPI000C7B057E|nr:hypothetical protein [Peptostreptococcus faecalis]